jgi:hypothetical protein
MKITDFWRSIGTLHLSVKEKLVFKRGSTFSTLAGFGLYPKALTF